MKSVKSSEIRRKNNWRLEILSMVMVVLILSLVAPSEAKSPFALTSPNAQSGGGFGVSVSMSGSLVIVGALRETALGHVQAGHAYIFNAKSDSLIQNLTSPNAQDHGRFGGSVGISNGIAIVGAYREASGGNLEAGNTYVYNASTGVLLRTLTSPNSQPGGWFGVSVAMSGSLMIVGAVRETVSGHPVAGHAYVFNATSGTLIQNLTSPNAQDDGAFGAAVAISGDLAIVGADAESVGGLVQAGHAYVFNASSGALIQTLTSPNVQEEGFFGGVAISGGIATVTGGNETFHGLVGAGRAYDFDANTGVLLHSFVSPNAQTGGGFGGSIAMSGKLITIGAPFESAGGHFQAGHAYVFNARTGARIRTLASLNPQDGGWFGWSAGMSRKHVVVGARAEAAGSIPNAGHAYIYVRGRLSP